MKNKHVSILIILFLLMISGFSQEKKTEGASEKDIARIMKTVFFHHYNKEEMNDDIIKQTMHNFLAKELDYQRLFFLKSDYDRWMEKSDLIAKAYGAPIGNVGEWKFIFQIHKEFEARYKAQSEATLQYLNKIESIDQSLTLWEDEEKRGFPNTIEESMDWLNFYVHYNLAYMMQKKKYTFLEAKAKLKEERKRNDAKRLKKTSFDVVKMFINAFNEVVDPHTNYYPPVAYQEFNDDMKLSFEGIGARLLRDEVSGVTMLVEIIPDGPAFKGGLLHKFDELLGVKEEKEEKFRDIVGLELNEVVRSIKGPANSTVILKIRRTEGLQVNILEIPIVRGKVNSKDEEATITYERITDGNKNSYLIGVLYLPSFYRDFDGANRGDKNARSSAADVEALLLEAQKNNIDGLILNLMGDSGGSLTDAIKIAGLFINTGPIVVTKNKKGEESVRKDNDPRVVYEGPLLVAINKRSASASEIVAGALKDYQRALVVGGESTFGKGTVQEIYPLGQTQSRGNIGAIKITINQFFTAGGDSTQWNGVASDIAFPSYYDGVDVGENQYPSALKFDKISSYVDMEEAKSKWFPITSEAKHLLKELSVKRVQQSSDFAKITKETQKTITNKAESKILKVANFYKNEDEDENSSIADFDLSFFQKLARTDLNGMVKNIEAMNIFPKKNFGIDESPAQYLAECMGELLKRDDLNQMIPRDIRHGANLKSRKLVKDIDELQNRKERSEADNLLLVLLRKKLLVEYYPDLRGPYQNTLFIKESLNIISDLINLQKSQATVDAVK